MKDAEKERLKQRLFPETVNKDDAMKKCTPSLLSSVGKRKVSSFRKRRTVFTVALFCCVLIMISVLLAVFVPSFRNTDKKEGGDNGGHDPNSPDYNYPEEDFPDIPWGDIFYASISYMDLLAEFDEPEEAKDYLSGSHFDTVTLSNSPDVSSIKAYGTGEETTLLVQELRSSAEEGNARGALFIVDDPTVKATLAYMKFLLSYAEVTGVPVYAGDSVSESGYSSLFFFEHDGYYYVYGLTADEPVDKEYYVEDIIGLKN